MKNCKKWMNQGCNGCKKINECEVVENFRICAALRK